MMTGRCMTCRHWKRDPDERGYPSEIVEPTDPDTYMPMEDLPFEVRECAHPGLLFCERPPESDGFALEDGSGYRASLFTGQDFGCVRWERREERA